MTHDPKYEGDDFTNAALDFLATATHHQTLTENPMTIAEQIAAAEAKAQATADRFTDAAHDPDQRKALAAQIHEDTAVLNALKAASR